MRVNKESPRGDFLCYSVSASSEVSTAGSVEISTISSAPSFSVSMKYILGVILKVYHVVKNLPQSRGRSLPNSREGDWLGIH